jgi:lipopolysaccharide-induced tumor necrosis factor-alpha factor
MNEIYVYFFLFIVSSPQPIPVYAQTTVIYPVMGTAFLGRYPASVQCQGCHQSVVTVVQHESGAGTWLISLLICLFGGVFGCCLIPFCVPGCQDAVHVCPACQSVIGRRNIL